MDKTQWPEFLTPAEMAAILRVSKMTAYRLLKEGQVDATRVGRSFRVHADSLRAYMRLPGAIDAREQERAAR